MQERLNAIQEKMDERQRILELPQRFAGSKQLSRREMEIENALFQGTDRHSFLRALYHQGVPPSLLFLWLFSGQRWYHWEYHGMEVSREVQSAPSAPLCRGREPR